MLVMKFPSGAISDPNADVFKQIRAETRAQLAQDRLVEGYEE